MPFSLPTFDDDLELYFRHVAHDSVLDIGAGDGTYGKMLRAVQPSAKRIGVEIDASYVEQFGLREIYDEMLVMDAARLMDDVRRTFGAVLVGDVIEHMRKSVGTDLLHFLVYRSKIIFVKFPIQMMQADWHGHVHEAHVSVWSAVDFVGLDHFFVKRNPMQMAVVRGYQNHAIEWLPQMFVQRLGYQSCTEYYNARPERWNAADYETLARQQSEAELHALISRGAKVIVIDEEQSSLLRGPGVSRIPFLEHDGQYFGMPANDTDAVAELVRQHQAGAQWVVFVANSFWALRFYPRFAEILRTRHRCVLENARLVVFRLT